jgi:[ribosomal protein S18]-alanine N-acetyltransferase
MDAITIRPMVAADLPAVLALEARCFPVPWTREHFLAELQSSLAFPRVATAGAGIVVGYLCAMLVLDEGQILNVAVDPDFRGRGIGRQLLTQVLAEFHQRRASFVALEVRWSNRAAISLYAGCGFRDVGRRKAYYHDGEDALLMEYDMQQYREGYNAV